MQCRALNFCFSVEVERSAVLTQSLGAEPSPSVPDTQLTGKDTYLLLWTQLTFQIAPFYFSPLTQFYYKHILLDSCVFPCCPLLPARVLLLYITPLLVGLFKELQHQQRFLASFPSKIFPFAPNLVSFSAGSSCLFSNPSLLEPLAVLQMAIIFSWISSLLTRD